MRGIYLACYKAFHPKYNIVYQDINGKRDISGDMLTVNLNDYDFIIATPPCNWWSRGNYRREQSIYALRTKLLLPCILYKLALIDRPFIVENVLNSKFFEKYQLFSIPNTRTFKIGRHTYWTNINFDTSDLQRNEREGTMNIQNMSNPQREGTKEVHEVIERFLKVVHKGIYNYV